MFRKIAASSIAAFAAAGLAVASAGATGLSGSPADPCADLAASCVTVAPAFTEFSSVRRNSATPPPVGTPTPEPPSSPPDDSGPGGPGPGDSGPAPTAPPLETAGPPAPEFTPVTAPPPVEPAPTSTTAPAEPRKPSEAVLPTAQPRLPQTAADSRLLTVAGGGSLIAAGLAWIGGARRRRKRPAGLVSG